jgi:hypothetical protein
MDEFRMGIVTVVVGFLATISLTMVAASFAPV